jgi:hypothetical protein
MSDERTRQDEQIALLRETVKKAFPAEKYSGAITQHDPGPWDEERDEEQALYETLKSKTWTETSPDFLQANPDAYLLLTPLAYRAFVAAWLNYSLEHMEGENEVREFLIYTCCPPGHCWEILSPLSPKQRGTVRALMSEFASRERSSSIREKAEKALARMDELIRAGEYVPWTE